MADTILAYNLYQFSSGKPVTIPRGMIRELSRHFNHLVSRWTRENPITVFKELQEEPMYRSRISSNFSFYRYPNGAWQCHGKIGLDGWWFYHTSFGYTKQLAKQFVCEACIVALRNCGIYRYGGQGRKYFVSNRNNKRWKNDGWHRLSNDQKRQRLDDDLDKYFHSS